MMRRRILFASMAAGVLSPGSILAQQKSLPVIGFLNGASYQGSANLVAAFHQGLAEAGYVEGRNVSFEYRSADGQYDRLPALAADLVRRQVSVIVATGTPTGLPAKNATTTIPIVFVTGSDPIDQGLVVSLSRPGGNLTGATTLAVEVGQKRMELLHDLIPSASRVGVLLNPTGPNLAAVTRDMETAARAVGMSLHVLRASTMRDLESVFPAFAGLGVGAVVIGVDTFFNSESARLATLALGQTLPAVYQYRDFVAAGGLMSYGGSIIDAYREVGVYAGRILKGENPADLPVQQSTKAELFINLKTARTLGLTIPPSILARADEVIE
jgi:putative tryptophan/tyrosine transport system substrate-binding protein